VALLELLPGAAGALVVATDTGELVLGLDRSRTRDLGLAALVGRAVRELLGCLRRLEA
jgi:predicted naringenin-chalcone synthase